MPKKPIVVSDIDDTLLHKGIAPMKANIAKLEALGLPIYLVTGRPESERAKTESALRNAGVHFSGLLMSPGDGKDKAQNDQFKLNHVLHLNKVFDVVTAIDNDPNILAKYSQQAGVNHPVLATEQSYGA